jgi:hypothetical protein
MAALKAMLRGEPPALAQYALNPIQVTGLKALGSRLNGVAITETFNAMRVGNASAMSMSPIVLAARWHLSETHPKADECDVLAMQDVGYGPGMYTPEDWPDAPHPYCGCFQDAPIAMTDPSSWGAIAEQLETPQPVQVRGTKFAEEVAKVLPKPVAPPQPFTGFPVEFRTSVAEAEKYLESLKSITYVKPTGFSEKTADLVTQMFADGLRDLEAVGVDLSDLGAGKSLPTLRLKPRLSTGSINGDYLSGPLDHTVRLNVEGKRGTYEWWKSASQHAGDVGWTATTNPRKTVHHEIGHALHRANIGFNAFHSSGSKFPMVASRRAIAARVSKYAMTDIREFVAETFTGLANGEKYDSEVLKLYDDVGGYTPKTNWPQFHQGATLPAPASTPIATVPPPVTPAPWGIGIAAEAKPSTLIRAGFKAGATQDEIMAELTRRDPLHETSMSRIRAIRRDMIRAKEIDGMIKTPGAKQTPLTLFQIAPPTDERVQLVSRESIMSEKLQGQLGSNPGGVYKGPDGVARYVKFYANPEQAWNEAIANRLYRDLGIQVPRSVLFNDGGKLGIASPLIENAGTYQTLGLTKERARKVLMNGVADAFLGNWDAVGLSLDNVVELADGSIARIDQGGALLYRAKAGLKPASLLTSLTEWETLTSAKNPAYAKVFQAAGVSGFEAPTMVENTMGQIQKIVDWANGVIADTGDFQAYLQRIAPEAPLAMRQQISEMLTHRINALLLKRQQVSNVIAKLSAAADALFPTSTTASPTPKPPSFTAAPPFAAKKTGTVAAAVGPEKAKRVRSLLRAGFKTGLSDEQIVARVLEKTGVQLNVEDVTFWRTKKDAQVLAGTQISTKRTVLNGGNVIPEVDRGPTRDQLPFELRRSLQHYNGSGAANEINPLLREVGQFTGQEKQEIGRHVANIDAIFRDHAPELTQDIRVFRASSPEFFGLQHGWHNNPEAVIGTTFTSKSFVSTSIEVKSSFGSTVAEIIVPAGKRVIWMNRMSGLHQQEKEVLLPRDWTFQIKGIERLKSGRIRLLIELL